MTTITRHNPVVFYVRFGAAFFVSCIALWFAYISAGTKWVTNKMLDFAARIGP